MSKWALGIIGILLFIGGMSAGWVLGGDGASVPHEPRAPRTAEEVAIAVEQGGEIRGILLEHDPLARIAALTKRLNEGGPETAMGVADVLWTGAPGLGSIEAAALTRFWALHDPRATAKWALSAQVPSGLRTIVAEALLESWAMVDLSGAGEALELHRRVASVTSGDAALSAYVRGWYASGEPGVVEYVRGIEDGMGRARAARALVHEKVQREGAEAVVQWLLDYPREDINFRSRLWRTAAPELFMADRDVAVAWCDAHCAELSGEHVRAFIVTQWVRDDGPGAMDWLRATPAGDSRDRAVSKALETWVWIDRDGMVGWAESIGPDGVEPWLYAGIDAIAPAVAKTDPAAAYAWAARVPDPREREQLMVLLLKRNWEDDPEAAQAWLEQSSLSGESREHFRAWVEEQNS